MDPAALQPGMLELTLMGIGAVLSLVAFICFIVVLVKMFQNNETTMGIVTIVTTLCLGIGQFVALIFGWMKSKEWNIKGLMMIYTASMLLGVAMFLGGYFLYGAKVYKEMQNNPEFQQQMQQIQEEMQQGMDGLEEGINIEVEEPTEEPVQ